MPITLDGTNGVTTNSGTLISATTIGVGGATPSTSGAGITFPATQSASTDANTLDDYEEGSWTPVFGSESGSFGAITYAIQVGRYTKVGNMVTAWARVNADPTTIGTASGTFSITGFPFASNSVTAMYAGSGWRGGGTGPATLGQLMLASATSVSPRKTDGTGVLVSDLASGGRNDFTVTITYMV